MDEQIAGAQPARRTAGPGPDRGQAITRPTLLANASPNVPDDLAIGLLGRRPTSVAARWRVEAASKDIDVAKAEFLPNVSLTASPASASLDTSKLLMGISRTFGFGPR